MNLIEGGRPRIGCIRRQPSAGKIILSIEKGHPSMGKMGGASRREGDRGYPRRSDQRPSGSSAIRRDRRLVSEVQG
jgi:hypothetical protein